MRTPSGSIATVVEVYDGISEVLVRWDATFEYAQFRMSQLRTLPGAEK